MGHVWLCMCMRALINWNIFWYLDFSFLYEMLYSLHKRANNKLISGCGKRANNITVFPLVVPLPLPVPQCLSHQGLVYHKLPWDSGTCYVAEDNFKLLILLLCLPNDVGVTRTLLCCSTDWSQWFKRSFNWATFPAPKLFFLFSALYTLTSTQYFSLIGDDYMWKTLIHKDPASCRNVERRNLLPHFTCFHFLLCMFSLSSSAWQTYYWPFWMKFFLMGSLESTEEWIKGGLYDCLMLRWMKMPDDGGTWDQILPW